MSINLAEIQQKVDRLLYNIAEQNRRAYQMFYDPTPQDVELPQLDENGNLITVTIPNRAKIKQQMWDDVNAAIGLWNRTFYVDQTNGDDNNPGTADAPFKTLEKAINSTPIDGKCVVYLLGTQYIMESNCNISNKTVFLNLADGMEFIFGIKEADTYYDFNSFIAGGSGFLYIGTASLDVVTKPKIKFADYTGTNSAASFPCGIEAIGSRRPLSIVVFLNNVEVYLSYLASGVATGVPLLYLRDGFGGILLTDTDVYTSSLGCLLQLTGSSGFLQNLFGNTFDDTSSIVKGIVKDANGVPRNILSNMIF